MPYSDKEKQQAAEKEWRDNHRDVVKKRRDSNKLRDKLFLRDYKEAHPCADCGKSFPHYVMEFDHRDPSVKLANVVSILGSRLKMLRELEKCDVVCANCHATRTWFRR